MSEKGTYDVFVSYSSKDKNVADAIVADFEQHGIRCWYAPRDIMPGTSWVSAITDALRMVKVQVLIYTDESNTSRQVMNEVALAFNEGKTIVPFRLSETRMSDEFEYYLSRVHWLDAITRNLADNITQLRNYVEVILSGVEKTGAAASPVSVKKRSNAYVISFICAGILVLALLSLTAYLIFRDSGSNEVQTGESGSESQASKPVEESQASKPVEESQADKSGAESQTGEPGKKDFYDMTVDELETAALKGDVAACELLGSMYYNGDKVDSNYEKARMYLERAVENDNTSAKVFKMLGDIYYYGKDVEESDEEAGRYYKTAIDMGLSNYDTLANYGMILYRDEKFEESAGYFERSAEQEPDPTTMYNAGLAYYDAGDSENAVKWLEKAIENGFSRSKDAKKLIESITG
ncbi:MAG: toll/interleukin-1 receptor domain-containing protein [Lachnospiraceae bacterium]|nr:toll/interleukin-1 receptor domain-containing protein [Lachnospiraceae bacterium]